MAAVWRQVSIHAATRGTIRLLRRGVRRDGRRGTRCRTRLNRSGCSRLTMCAAPSKTSSRAPGTVAARWRMWPFVPASSRSPSMTSSGMRSSLTRPPSAGIQRLRRARLLLGSVVASAPSRGPFRGPRERDPATGRDRRPSRPSPSRRGLPSPWPPPAARARPRRTRRPPAGARSRGTPPPLTTRERTRSGYSSAKSSAITPPRDSPTMCADASPRWSSSAAMSARLENSTASVSVQADSRGCRGGSRGSVLECRHLARPTCAGWRRRHG